jgi:tRNA(Ile)-lysidine synthase TilS/MesJ
MRKQYGLQWREDATNQDTKYLRNELRQKLTKLSVRRPSVIAVAT